MTTAPISRGHPHEVARYIEGLTRELKDMAVNADLSLVAYLLAMVTEEAAAAAADVGDIGVVRRRHA